MITSPSLPSCPVEAQTHEGLSYRPPSLLTQIIETKVELRDGGVEGQGLSYRLPPSLPQGLDRKVEPHEGGVEGQRLSDCPPCNLPQSSCNKS